MYTFLCKLIKNEIIFFYSGILYHSGQKSLVLKTFTQGDYITAIFDTESRTLSFAKNNDYPVVAFQNIDTKTKLYPCVLCYSTAAGQKVNILLLLIIL